MTAGEASSGSLPEDIARRVIEWFSEPDRSIALAMLSRAVIHDGKLADDRLRRCALVASKGSLEKLQYYVDLLKVDYRDVIVAGEYEVVGGKLARVRNLTTSF
jgi:hypothetical protein